MVASGTRPVCVVGGGLTGLVVAYRLVARGVDVALLERDARLGGQIHTVTSRGLPIELGAEGFIARSAAVPALCRDLGIEADLLDQHTTLTYSLEEAGLRELAPGEAAALLGFQVPKEELGRGIRTLRAGMGQLVDALVGAIGSRARVLLEAPVEVIRPSADGPIVTLASGVEISARDVVLTAPAPKAGLVLAPFGEEVTAGLVAAKNLSNASASLLYGRAQVAHSLEGSGFIVPPHAQTSGFRACSFVTTKFQRSGPEGLVLLRAFFRPTDDDLARYDERAWIDLAAERVSGPLGIEGPPIAGWASVWPRALAVYDDQHRSAVARAEQALGAARVALAGSHVHGAGIDAAVVSAERAASLLTS